MNSLINQHSQMELAMKKNNQRIFLTKAKKNKNDEFYTQLSDIENELKHYEQHFKKKVVLCNCDDPRTSNFFKYFVKNFKKLKLKKIIASCYKDTKLSRGYYCKYDGLSSIDEIIYFNGDGDFRNHECLELLKEADIIVSNPPFSLFREYIRQITEYNKNFLIIGNINCITYKEVFNLIQNNKAWLGINFGRKISGFIVPNNYELYGTETRIDQFGNRIVSPNNCLWLTNLDIKKRHEKMGLTKKYFGNENDYPIYDNYNGINVDKTNNIPLDYNGVMGVPITFLNKFNPDQFEIVKFRKGDDNKDLSIQGKKPYFRILIRHKKK